MKGDFSRMTFAVANHFTRVLMQQGRVQLDADWNEQTSILLHYLHSLAKDLIGEHGGPKDVLDDNKKNVISKRLGFEVIVDPERIKQFSELDDDQKEKLIEKLEKSKPPILIGKGHYYIDGILCEIDHFVGFDDQEDYPWYKDKDLDKGNYLVYVDVWERHATYLEEPNIREVALGGPDTATRAKVVWQVKTENNTPDGSHFPSEPPAGFKNWREWADKQWPDWKKQWQPANRGRLKAQAKNEPKKEGEPCITSPESSYRGTENQLYRVEIHQGGNLKDKPTFKWSRDNGSVLSGIKLNGTEITVENLRSRFSAGQWLELTNDEQELRGEVGTLVKIKKIDHDIVSLAIDTAPMPKAVLPNGEPWPTKARLWESDETPITESDKDWMTLRDGVQIQFQPSLLQNEYRTGDYWLIPARVATGDVEWPGDIGKPEPLPPHGVEHHYAPLAIITVPDSGAVSVQQPDLRNEFIDLVKPVKS